MLFYKSITVINVSKASIIYPVEGTVISKNDLKPSLTFGATESIKIQEDKEREEAYKK